MQREQDGRLMSQRRLASTHAKQDFCLDRRIMAALCDGCNRHSCGESNGVGTGRQEVSSRLAEMLRNSDTALVWAAGN